jgi:adenine-specific DNA-methyltransferase
MDKLKMHSLNKIDENINKLSALFPNVLTEVSKGYREDGSAIIERAIDFDLLRQELSSVIVEGAAERYQFTWPDKKKSFLLANAPIAKTLRPCREESVAFDNTENLYIEGDNLDVLKLLQETYLGKVKMIYIDPPYNTGNDFVYEDNFTQNVDEYLANSGQYDGRGNRLVQNMESNGRFHTDWLNMIYPRLRLAKALLTDDGVIFISIGNEEVENCKKICNEIFGEDNFRNAIIIRRGAKNLQSQFDSIDALNSGYEYVLMYSRTVEQRFAKVYKIIDEKAVGSWNNHWRGTDRPTMRYPLFEIKPQSGQWRWGEARSLAAIKNYRQLLKDLQTSNPTQEQIDQWYLTHTNSGEKIDLLRLSKNGKPEHYIAPSNCQLLSDLWDDLKPNGSSYTAKLFDTKVFDNPKSVDLIRRLIEFGAPAGSIILDFFSGSATTAQAVIESNLVDQGKRKFIMVQLPEETAAKSEASKAGFKNICEIGKERIRRVGKRYPKSPSKLDVGFRVLKVDSSNMEDVYYKPAEYRQDLISSLVNNIKPNRTPEDLLFQVMLDLGVLLSCKIEEIIVGGKKVSVVADGYLIACFDSNVTEEVITEIAKKHPYYAVFRDSGLADDSVAANFEQIFETYSPSTVRKVL